jgi:hypothetical protein
MKFRYLLPSTIGRGLYPWQRITGLTLRFEKETHGLGNFSVGVAAAKMWEQLPRSRRNGIRTFDQFLDAVIEQYASQLR